MKDFVRLFDELDSTTSTNEKVSALERFFRQASDRDALWALLLLTGRMARKVLTSRGLKDLFLIATEYPEWLLDECASHVGDTAETLSLLAQTLGKTRSSAARDSEDVPVSLTEWMETRIPAIGQMDDQADQARELLAWWSHLDQQEVFVLNKLMTGAFRVGVSEKLVIRALSAVFEKPTDQIAHRLTGLRAGAHPDTISELLSGDVGEVATSQPYPFCLANSWSKKNESEFAPADWIVEWKFDGIRAQVISRPGGFWIWSRGEDEITASFPDLEVLLRGLPEGTVLDGEILILRENEIAPFQDLQKRLGRKKVSPTTIKSHPAGFIAYDCLEFGGRDIRDLPLMERKQYLDTALRPFLNSRIRISEMLEITGLEDIRKLREDARERSAEGLMIKSKSSRYVVGRKTGNWWKHKVDPLTLDAVLLYAQAGSGRRANLYTDYTFALWNAEKKLVPFAKAYSGLDQSEIDELDQWIRRHTTEKFGPVRSVEPHHVFEIGFEGIGPSSRHKSGIAVRFPRILRWRRDKPIEEADTLGSAQELISGPGL